uniref:hypothetical protein n=1 Tax=Paractinoplanes polyasparticus TaxID=2856853 RepID=UPI001C84A032|nr:hypothetical protein [Actinoplanes polyasparticus]
MNLDVPPSHRGSRVTVALGLVLLTAVVIAAIILGGAWDHAYDGGRQLVLQLRNSWQS